jgi:hypothetical protein
MSCFRQWEEMKNPEKTKAFPYCHDGQAKTGQELKDEPEGSLNKDFLALTKPESAWGSMVPTRESENQRWSG